ncbi:hypothetical protein A3I40_02345 [Candidatus Uhrbacteria bacterium RIFCSPLOWO2_02_FULL_48_12]|uniref:Uncharacterized protein n=1 Tax=Candidatus Uhrbacteria bacterium RIFCSPLOWO2_02_FULL_48_12 TaxID=1802407 RepID=A0A1F7VAH1_9BACT|nr:MAG: hypothetical protein A3I40_02345 [Candidatus Uhrbacteria bacterium RIFCSPLOWO2_02_FULL_48_12]
MVERPSQSGRLVAKANGGLFIFMNLKEQRICRQSSKFFNQFLLKNLLNRVIINSIKNLKLSSARRSCDFRISRGAFLAAFGGENCPNYLKNRPLLHQGSRFAREAKQVAVQALLIDKYAKAIQNFRRVHICNFWIRRAP